MGLNHADRLAQIGGGDIEIKFRKRNDNFVVFMQADGEFYKIVNPRSVTIKLADWLSRGSIHVIRRKKW